MSYYVARVQLTIEVDTPKGTKTKKTTETYLVEALSVTEAEAKVITDLKVIISISKLSQLMQVKIIKNLRIMSYKTGRMRLIVTKEGVNHVGIILDNLLYLINLQCMMCC